MAGRSVISDQALLDVASELRIPMSRVLLAVDPAHVSGPTRDEQVEAVWQDLARLPLRDHPSVGRLAHEDLMTGLTGSVLAPCDSRDGGRRCVVKSVCVRVFCAECRS